MISSPLANPVHCLDSCDAITYQSGSTCLGKTLSHFSQPVSTTVTPALPKLFASLVTQATFSSLPLPLVIAPVLLAISLTQSQTPVKRAIILSV